MSKSSSLDFPLDTFQDYLQRAVELIIQQYQAMPDTPAYNAQNEAQVRAHFNEPLPEAGAEFANVLQQVSERVYGHATMNIAPKMFAYVMSGGNQVAVIADLLNSAINQNVTKWHLAPSLTEIERCVIRWAAEFIGLPSSYGGAVVTGGSGANLAGLTVARNVYFKDQGIREQGWFGQTPCVVYASTETHNSVLKSIELLGIGRNQYRQIPVLADYTIDTQALRQQIQQDREQGLKPFCVVGNAGTVNTGAIDPLNELADIAQQEQLWLHVDGCYGGLASALNELSEQYIGMERADSIALDFHKWWYQNFEIGCVLVKNWQQLYDTYYTPASYLDEGPAQAHSAVTTSTEPRFNITEHHFDLSRNGKALKAWMSLKTFGAERMRQMIRKDIQLTCYLAEQIHQCEDLELVSPPCLGIVCFRYIGATATAASNGSLDQHDKQQNQEQLEAQIDRWNRLLIPALEQDGRVFITGTTLHQRRVVRACLINHRLSEENIDYLVAVVREVAASISKN